LANNLGLLCLEPTFRWSPVEFWRISRDAATRANATIVAGARGAASV
jgi:hypothetical protein